MDIHIQIDDRLVGFFRRLFRRRLVLAGTAVLVLASAGLLYASVPHTFETGTIISSSQVNANFATLDEKISALEGAPTPMRLLLFNPNLGPATPPVIGCTVFANVPLTVTEPTRLLVEFGGTAFVNTTINNAGEIEVNLSRGGVFLAQAVLALGSGATFAPSTVGHIEKTASILLEAGAHTFSLCVSGDQSSLIDSYIKLIAY